MLQSFVIQISGKLPAIFSFFCFWLTSQALSCHPSDPFAHHILANNLNGFSGMISGKLCSNDGFYVFNRSNTYIYIYISI